MIAIWSWYGAIGEKIRNPKNTVMIRKKNATLRVIVPLYHT
jgi:hypothetical protein